METQNRKLLTNIKRYKELEKKMLKNSSSDKRRLTKKDQAFIDMTWLIEAEIKNISRDRIHRRVHHRRYRIQSKRGRLWKKKKVRKRKKGSDENQTTRRTRNERKITYGNISGREGGCRRHRTRALYIGICRERRSLVSNEEA